MESLVEILFVPQLISAGVPSNTSRPSLMKITRLHIASTSCRMCVDSRIVFVSPNAANRFAHFANLIRIETRRRLVENQHVRLVQQHLGHAHALPKAFRQLADRLADHAAQFAQIDDRLRSALRSALATCPRAVPKNRNRLRGVMSGYSGPFSGR